MAIVYRIVVGREANKHKVDRPAVRQSVERGAK